MCWRRFLRVPWTARRSNQWIPKEISPEYSLEGLMLRLKLQYFGHLMWRTGSLEKTLMLGKTEGRRRRGDRGWDGWMASLTWRTWVWARSGSWWWTGRPGVLQTMESQRVRHKWGTELNWTCHEVMGQDATILVFWMLSFKPVFSLSSFTLIKRLFSFSLFSATREVSSAHLRLLVFLLAILIPACDSSSPAFRMMCSSYKLNKAGRQYIALTYSFPNFELVYCSMSGSNCCFLTCTEVSQETGKVVWYSHLFRNIPQFIIIHRVKGFSVVKETDFFFNSLAFSRIQRISAIWSLFPLPLWNPACTSWKLSVHILLKPSLKDFAKRVQLYSSLNILWHCSSLEQ